MTAQGEAFEAVLVSLQPLGNKWVETLDAFPMESVAGTFIEVQLCVRYGMGHFFGHPARRENIRCAANDQRRTLDLAQIGKGIVADAGRRLCFECMERLGQGGACRLSPPVEQAGEAIGVIPRWFAEDQQLDIGHELLGPEAGLDGTHVFEDAAGISIAAGPRAHQDERTNPLGMTQCELLGDDAAH